MEISRYCNVCVLRHRCEKQVNDMLDIKPSCYRYCQYDVLKDGIEINCQECQQGYKCPYDICCLDECGQHEFCRSCNLGIYFKQRN